MTVLPSGIESGEQVGAAQLMPFLNPYGVPSGEALGGSFLPIVIRPAGIETNEAFGTILAFSSRHTPNSPGGFTTLVLDPKTGVVRVVGGAAEVETDVADATLSVQGGTSARVAHGGAVVIKSPTGAAVIPPGRPYSLIKKR